MNTQTIDKQKNRHGFLPMPLLASNFAAWAVLSMPKAATKQHQTSEVKYAR